jgi:hypothetical protein
MFLPQDAFSQLRLRHWSAAAPPLSMGASDSKPAPAADPVVTAGGDESLGHGLGHNGPGRRRSSASLNIPRGSMLRTNVQKNCLKEFSCNSAVWSIDMSKDRSIVVSGDASHCVTVWDALSGNQ